MAYSIFTRDDIADFKEVFEYFDKRNRGHITRKQMVTTLRSLIPKPKENDITCLMENISFKNTVNFREYLDILHATIESNRKKQIHDKKPRRKRSHYTNLTQDQLNDIRDTFTLFDRDGDGTISVHELQDMMTSLGQRVSEADIKEMLEDTDTSADGTLDYPAFMSMMTRKSANNDLNCEIKEAFKFFDQDGDGTITKEELKICMKRIGEDLSDEDLNEMLNEADLDGNGKIEFHEFAKLITWPKS
ncbi:calmodulin-like [Clytia hemisphaerica]|uniref:EF-hand domain-containing protein n=1 Tax=Clytia hemisphaerica TaxID=252671 RepID=A0A7M5VGI5_9CNID|eukprot:TCONS_00057660-protein